MKEAKCSDAAVAAFKQNYDQLVAGVTGLVSLNRYEHDAGRLPETCKQQQRQTEMMYLRLTSVLCYRVGGNPRP